MNHHDAEEYTQSLGQIVAGSWRQVALAKRLGVPKALGLTVDQWVNDRLGGYIKMSVAERREAVKELTADGHSNRGIAVVIGVDESTVRDDKTAGFPAPDGEKSTKDSNGRSEIAGNPAPLDAVAALAAEEKVHRVAKQIENKKQRQSASQDRYEDTVQHGCTVDDLREWITRGDKFGSIYADPPWLYDNQGTRAATGNHYSGMTVEALCELPIGDLAADNSHLHLWTTNGFLFECPKILKAWGFEFRSTFVWIKPQIGIGNYWRNAHEILLTAIRGDAKRFADKSLKSWIVCDRGEHSDKPDQVRNFLERASPGPRLELFARRLAPGWRSWGNQIERTIFDTTAREVA